MKQYVTFGQVHAHRVDGKTLDCDCVAVFEAEDCNAGRAKAFLIFGQKFSFHYTEDEWNDEDMVYYPRGYIELK